VANLTGIGRASETLPTPSPVSRPLAPGTGRAYDADEQRILDVRGYATDEALEQVTAALDRATLEGTPALRIIHGHGTGKLKAALRTYLKASPYVAHARPGDRAEGGDGVTVVTIR
jgi:DNA mismatch repair protein MutS2